MTKAKTEPKARKRAAPKPKAKTSAKSEKKAKVAPVAFVEENPANREQQAKSDGRFTKGQSGNPSGRPKVVKEFKKIALEYAPAALKFLHDVMQDDAKPTSARVTAAMALLDRGLGKPIQQVEVGKPGDFTEMGEHEIDAFIAQASRDLAHLSASGYADHAVH